MKKTIFKASFKNVDYPKLTNVCQLFEHFEDAVKALTKKANKHSIINPKWEMIGGETYFNHQFENHPTEGSSYYHGSIKKVQVR